MESEMALCLMTVAGQCREGTEQCGGRAEQGRRAAFASAFLISISRFADGASSRTRIIAVKRWLSWQRLPVFWWRRRSSSERHRRQRVSWILRQAPDIRRSGSHLDSAHRGVDREAEEWAALPALGSMEWRCRFKNLTLQRMMDGVRWRHRRSSCVGCLAVFLISSCWLSSPVWEIQSLLLVHRLGSAVSSAEGFGLKTSCFLGGRRGCLRVRVALPLILKRWLFKIGHLIGGSTDGSSKISRWIQLFTIHLCGEVLLGLSFFGSALYKLLYLLI